jgi:hypothetical protein
LAGVPFRLVETAAKTVDNGQGSDLTAVGGPFRLDMRRRAGRVDKF